MDALFTDLKYSIRMFLKSPGFTLIAVAAIALGIGGTIAIFSIVNTVLLTPLEVPEPERLVALSAPNGGAVSPAIFMHWRAEASIFQGVSAYSSGVVNYTGSDAVEVWQYVRASSDYFRCWGLPIVRGRGFTAEEDMPNTGLVAVISESLWRRHFANDPQILGREISLNGEPHTVIGIAGHDPSSQFSLSPDVYVPFQIDPKTTEQGAFFSAIARLRPGVTLDQAKARLRVSTAEYRARFPKGLGAQGQFHCKAIPRGPKRSRPSPTAHPFLFREFGVAHRMRQRRESIACARNRPET